MPIGSVVCIPHCEYAVNRAYVRGVLLGERIGATLIQYDNPLVISVPSGGYTSFGVFKFKDEFWRPSSNTYTLGWVIEDAYFWNTIEGEGVKYPLNVFMYHTTVNDCPGAFIQCSDVAESRIWRVPLEQVSPFWTPLPPCLPILT